MLTEWVLSLEPDAFWGEMETEVGKVEIVSHYAIKGDILELWQFHVDGPGAGSFGISRIRAAIIQLGRQFKVRRVVLSGGTRMTGAGVGPKGLGQRKPQVLIFDVE